jgi:amino acid adenylation domain-containing protein
MLDERLGWRGEQAIRTIHDYVRLQSARSPETVAIHGAGRAALTYAGLVQALDATGTDLAQAGISRADRVALLLPQGPDAAVATLAIAGHSPCAPVNPALAIPEVGACLRRLNARALLVPEGASSPAVGVAERLGMRILELRRDGEGAVRIVASGSGAGASSAPAGYQAGEGPALLLFTSGTSFEPKLVPLSHRQICFAAENIAAVLDLTARDVCLGVMPLHHIHGLSTLFATLVSGGSYVGTPAFSLDGFLADLVAFRPTWYSAAPAIHRAIAVDSRVRDARHSLRFVRSASAAMPAPWIAGIEAALGVPLIESYGMTEAAPQIASNRLPPEERKPGSVGRPAGPDVAIMDDAGGLLNSGETGEVAIRGTNVIDRYEGETGNDAFVDGWLRTGDIGHLDGDGFLFITGRAKDIINRGGEKIAPARVEEVLLRHRSIAEAVAFAMPDPLLGETVAAAVVLKAGAALDRPTGAIRAFAAPYLAPFELPQRVMVVAEIPRTPQGKISRTGLADALPEPDAGTVAPSNATQRRVAEIFSDVLKSATPGIDADFFELGGNSLSALRVLARLQAVFDVELPVDVLFASPTVAGVAERIGARMAELVATGERRLVPPRDASAETAPARRPGPVPLARAQQRVYFLDQMGAGAAYTMSAPLWLTGAVDESALARALDEIVRRHEILRASFPMRGDRPVQVVGVSLPPLAISDLTALPAATRAGEAKRLALDEATRPFDLERGPLFRTRLVRISERESVLLLTMHHIISDAWSVAILHDELRQLYDAFRSGAPSPLAALAAQYADFALREEAHIREGRLDGDAAYWGRQLNGVPPASTFPADAARPAVQSFRGETIETFLDAPLVARLGAIARDGDATPFMVLLAAFQTLLSRYNGQEDCVVGVPIAGRPEKAFEALIGFFANTLAMRNSLAGDPSFTDLLGRVRATALDAFAHRDMPMERIVEDLKLARDPGHPPLFQVMFAFQNFGATAGSSASSDVFANPPFQLGAGVTARPFRVDNGTAKFDLTLYLSEAGEGMSLTWQFNRDLFEPATIRRIASHFEMLLGGIAAAPSRRLSEYPLLSDAERERIEVDWNRTSVDQAFTGSVIEMFEAAARRTPDAVAVTAGEATLTYAALNTRANRLAWWLRERGVGPGSLTGVCLPRTADGVAVLLGIWKAGGAFLPIDADHPPLRIASMLKEAGVRLVVTESALLARLGHAAKAVADGGGARPGIACIDVEAAAIASHSAANPDEAPSAGALAYAIYTSGSTGTPKGVMITHGNLCHYAQALAPALGLRPGDRNLHTASFSFSSSLRQFAVPLSCGAAVVVATAEETRDPERLFETIRERGVTVVDLVPSHAANCLRVLSTLAPDAGRNLLANAVRLMLFASEPLPAKLVAGWRGLCRPGTQFINMYGQTETSGIVLTYPIPEDAGGAAIVPLGKPIANIKAYVLDTSGRSVPIGVAGELHLAGPGIGRGYLAGPLRDPAPFASTRPNGRESERLYRTGDLARFRADSVIAFAGRGDSQIKVRGFRIEPREIEAVIEAYPGVHECAVRAEGEILTAFAVDDRAEPDEAFAAGLRAFVGERLPSYMVPARVVRLTHLPRTASGKVDAAALPAAVRTSPGRYSPTAPSADGAEHVLAGIWRKVLGAERVGRSDNFFDLGGNSSLAIRVLFEARQAGLPVSLRQIYQHQTIAGLARAIAGAPPEARPTLDVAQPGGRERAPPVTVDSLREFGREALMRAGLAPDGAAIVAEVQLEASLRGQPTHDMVSIPRYAARIAAGVINPKPDIRIERETAATALVDGDNGPGQWVSMVAMSIAIGKARAHAIGLVGVRRSNHFGAAGHYAWEATRQGLIGLCTTNGPAVLAPTGGVMPTLGNNPLAIGIPAGRHPPILLDIAMSVAPRSKIGLAVAEGGALPEGWILDSAGRPSTDLAALAAGLGVPIGGHKGYGLALALEALAGVLSGAGFGADHRPETLRESLAAPDFGHLFVAIDPARFMAPAAFAERVDRLIDDIHNGRRAAGAGEILVPGEMELRARAQSLAQGVRLLPSTYRALVAYGREKGLDTRLVTLPDGASL